MEANRVLESIETGATLVNSPATTVGGNEAIHKGNMSSELDLATVQGQSANEFNRRNTGSLSRHFDRELLGLQLWHNFELAAGGDIDDWSQIHGTSSLNNGASIVAGKYGSGVSFDGIDDFCGTRLAYTGATKDHGLTCVFWLNKSSGGDSGQRYISCDLSDWWGCWEANPGEVTFRAQDNGGTTAQVTGTYTEGTWEHWAGVVDLSVPELRLYKNGSLVGSNPMGSATLGHGTNDRHVNIGCGSESTSFNTSQSGTFMAGSMDDVRVYHRALSQSTVNDIMNNQA